MFEPANNRKKSDVSSGFSRLQRVYHKNKITLDPTFEVAAEAGAATQRLGRLPLSSAVFFCPTQFPIELSHMCSAAYRKRPGVCLQSQEGPLPTSLPSINPCTAFAAIDRLDESFQIVSRRLYVVNYDKIRNTFMLHSLEVHVVLYRPSRHRHNHVLCRS